MGIVGLGLLFGASAVWAVPAKEVRDGKYWIDIPTGEEYTISDEDMPMIMPEGQTHLDLWKIGEGTLVMTTNNNTEALKDYTGNIYATNGLLKVMSEYGLGKNGKSGQTYVLPGAALDSAYQRDEKATGGASVGITQSENIHVAGTGFGEYGALNETEGNHIMLGTVTLDGDARLGRSGNTLQVRYKTLDFNNHQITSGGPLGFGSLTAANAPAVPLVMTGSRNLTFTGTGLVSTESNHTIVFRETSKMEFEGGNSDSYLWTLDFQGTNTFHARSISSKAASATNTWKGVIRIADTLYVSYNNDSVPLTFAGPVVGGGRLVVNANGTLTLGAADHRIRRLDLANANRKIKLPADFVLQVQEFHVGSANKPAGDYTSANCANILSGTVRVNPDFPVYQSKTTAGADYTLDGEGSISAPQFSVAASGACAVTASGHSRVHTTFTGLTSLLNRSRFHVDAANAGTFVYHATWLSTNGLKGVTQWRDARDADHRFNNFTLTGEWSATKQAYHRYVSAYPTVQDYTVNGVTRPYVDMGEIDGLMGTAENYYENSFSASPTTAAMSINKGADLQGLEYHVVFGDAHPNPTNKNRMALIGRPNCGTSGQPEYMAGRRGANGKLYAQMNNVTVSFRDGRIWADNVSTDSTYTPDWDEVHVYTMIPTNAFVGTTHADYLNLMNIGLDSYARYGGARYGELLVYSGATNTAAERTRIDAYLMKKWTGRGTGAEMTFESFTLQDGAAVTLDNTDYADVGFSYRIGALKGAGTLSANDDDLLCVDNLEVSFTSRTTCEKLTVSSACELAAAGVVKVTVADGVRSLKAGSYPILDLSDCDNAAALDGWTLDCADPLVGLRRDGNTLYLDVDARGMVILFR